MAKDMLQPEQIKSVGAKRYVAQVVDVDDHDRLLRVKVRVMVMHPESLSDDELPWAEYALPPGNRYDNGTFIHVEVGDYIWVDFPYDGDVRRPRMLASIHYAPNSQPEFPHEAWLGPDAVAHKRIVAPYPAARQYFQNNVFSEFGLVIEIVPNGSVIITQKSTGSAIEIHYGGAVTVHSEGDAYVEAKHDVVVYAQNDVLITAEHNVAIAAGNNVTIQAGNQFNINGVAGFVVGSHQLLLQGGAASILLSGSIAECSGDFHSNGTIMDAGGNTNHHSHG